MRRIDGVAAYQTRRDRLDESRCLERSNGYSHPIVTAFYLALSVVMGGLGLICRQGSESAASLSAVAATAILMTLLIGVILVERK